MKLDIKGCIKLIKQLLKNRYEVSNFTVDGNKVSFTIDDFLSTADKNDIMG
jgi:hypothetical protein